MNYRLYRKEINIMSIILVWKGKSACMVDKYRDPEHKGKYIEKYIGSIGVISNTEMLTKREALYVYDNNVERMAFALRNFKFIEVAEDTPRRKTPVGDIREQPVKKEKRVKKEKKTKEVIKKYYPGVTYAPVTYKTHTEIMREREIEKREIEAGKPKSIPIPDYIKSKGKKIAFLSNLQQEYREDIKEYRKGIREEEIKMAPSLYAQRKEKMVVAKHKSEIKAAEGMIDKIDKQKEGLR
jgi:hypothetical protein